MNHKLAERLEELQRECDNAIANHNYGLAEQLDMEINHLMEHEEEFEESNTNEQDI